MLRNMTPLLLLLTASSHLPAVISLLVNVTPVFVFISPLSLHLVVFVLNSNPDILTCDYLDAIFVYLVKNALQQICIIKTSLQASLSCFILTSVYIKLFFRKTNNKYNFLNVINISLPEKQEGDLAPGDKDKGFFSHLYHPSSWNISQIGK